MTTDHNHDLLASRCFKHGRETGAAADVLRSQAKKLHLRHPWFEARVPDDGRRSLRSSSSGPGSGYCECCDCPIRAVMVNDGALRQYSVDGRLLEIALQSKLPGPARRDALAVH